MVHAIAEAMFSQDGEVGDARLSAHVTDVDGYVSAASRPIRLGLRLALFVVQIAPILVFFRMSTLCRLNVEDRVRVLSRLERAKLAPLSLAFVGWRTVMTLVFYEDPGELRKIGYAGEERRRYKRRLPALPAVATVDSGAPPPQDSGIRLRKDAETDTPSAPVVEAAKPGGSREVA